MAMAPSRLSNLFPDFDDGNNKMFSSASSPPSNESLEKIKHETSNQNECIIILPDVTDVFDQGVQQSLVLK